MEITDLPMNHLVPSPTVAEVAVELAKIQGISDLKEPARCEELREKIRAAAAASPNPAPAALHQLGRILGQKRPSLKKFQQELGALQQAIAAAQAAPVGSEAQEESGSTGCGDWEMEPCPPPAAEAAPTPAAAVEIAAAPETPQFSLSIGGALAQDPQMVADFLLESREHLSNIEAQLLVLEQNSAAEESIHSAFRSFHTMKGLAGFLEFNAMQEVAHEVETVLDLARNSKLTLEGERIDVILHAGDYLSQWISYIEAAQAGKEGLLPADPAALIVKVRQAAEDIPMVVAPSPSGGAPQSPAADATGETAPATEVNENLGGALKAAKAETSVVKVDTAKLEYLVDMVGELVIAQSMLHHNPDLATAKTPRVQRDLAQLGRVTGEVQKTAMAMRMVPIGIMFRRMNRLVRDLSRKSGKQVELELVGEDVELDRTIVEELADPIVHMLRNSLDHGLEGPDEREAAGKSRTGKVQLKAWHQAGQIAIEISDDGRGLNKSKILAKAISRGLIDPSQNHPEAEIFQLIFHPGFSTADKVTDVSGRGVGMDVVRKHVEKLRGRIDIESTPGHGTKFLLKLPLTLAIIDGLVVLIGTERFIVPLFSVREMIRPSQDMLFTVENRAEMALVREKLLPVIRLYQRLNVTPKSENPCDGLFIVGEAGGRNFCLLVDELVGKQEVVIKSLGPVFEAVEGVAGGAILGDGRVGLILDVNALIQKGSYAG